MFNFYPTYIFVDDVGLRRGEGSKLENGDERADEGFGDESFGGRGSLELRPEGLRLIGEGKSTLSNSVDTFKPS